MITGVKNAEDVRENFLDTFTDEAQNYLNLEDRSGHPSLAVPFEGYEGDVLFAGWICQREEKLEIFMQTGRYSRHDLSFDSLDKLNIVTAYLFVKAYGFQDVDFVQYDANNQNQFFDYLENKPYSTEPTVYHFSKEFLKNINKGLANHTLDAVGIEVLYNEEMQRQTKKKDEEWELAQSKNTFFGEKKAKRQKVGITPVEERTKTPNLSKK